MAVYLQGGNPFANVYGISPLTGLTIKYPQEEGICTLAIVILSRVVPHIATVLC